MIITIITIIIVIYINVYIFINKHILKRLLFRFGQRKDILLNNDKEIIYLSIVEGEGREGHAF